MIHVPTNPTPKPHAFAAVPPAPGTHPWALFDPQGRIHDTCRASTFREAAYIFKLSDSQVAEGWSVGDTSSEAG